MTLESLYSALGDCDETTERQYDLARKAKVAQIAEYIATFMKEPHYAGSVAEAIMASAEEMGRIDGDSISGELSSHYTTTRNPNAFTL